MRGPTSGQIGIASHLPAGPSPARSRQDANGLFRCLFLVPLALALTGCGESKSRVVLYCAQDQEVAEKVLRDFTRATGYEVAAHYDTEADKSVSIYEELVRERGRPRCDVHWNNE